MTRVAFCQDVVFGYQEHGQAHPLLKLEHVELMRGEWTLLYGASGSGKTTVLQALAGQGGVLSGSLSLYYTPEEVAYVPQQSCLLDVLNVRENILFLAEVRKVQAEALLHTWAHLLGLEKHLTQSIYGLSGGERMKVSLLRALCAHPKILFLDEPTSHWDAATTHLVMQHLAALKEQLALTIVMVSHDQSLKCYADFALDLQRDPSRTAEIAV